MRYNLTEKSKIIEAKKEAQRFIKKVNELEKHLINNDRMALLFGCKESGAVRRASMDLTRALSEMRSNK